MQEYDYIVAGGGSAGCVLASRLSEDPGTRVLLIESGQRDNDKYIHIPATFFKVIEKGVDMHFYASESEKGLNGRPSLVPQGNVLGGGSSVNASTRASALSGVAPTAASSNGARRSCDARSARLAAALSWGASESSRQPWATATSRWSWHCHPT